MSDKTITTERESVKIARRFHEAYERLAPQFGYETRAETREFDPKSPNGRLMIAVVNDLFYGLDEKPWSKLSDSERRAKLDSFEPVTARYDPIRRKNIVG